MKPLKTSRTVKSPRGRSPSKKIQTSRKLGPFRPPQHLISNRSVAGQSSSGVKRSGLMPPHFSSKSSKPSPNFLRSRVYASPQRLQPRKNQQAAFTVDRARGLKKGGYDKKHQFSHSPIEGRIAERESSLILPRGSSPHVHSSQYSPISKKKSRREETHYGHQISPSQSRYSSENRTREKNSSRVATESHHRGPPASNVYEHACDRKYMIPSSKEKLVYGSDRDGYNAPCSSGQMSREKSMMNTEDMICHQRGGGKQERELTESYTSMNKNYALTLDERFRAVSGDCARARTEQRIQYSREELENITVDVKRNIREYSPTLRRIIDPTEVKLVRRPEEGHRPIFDREEIKQASRDLREDAHVEQKMYSMKVSGHNAFNQKDMENYEITRHKFDTYRGPALHMDGHPCTLTEKYHRLDNKKNERITTAEREEKSRGFVEQQHGVGDYEKKYRTRSASNDRDFRIRTENRSRIMYESDMLKILPSMPSETNRYKASSTFLSHDGRYSLDRRGNSNHRNLPEALTMESRSWYPGMQRHSTDVLSSHEKLRSNDLEHGRNPRVPSWIDERNYDRPQVKDEKSSLLVHKPNRSKYNPYFDKSSEMLRGSPMNKYDDRESPRNPRTFSARGSYRGFRTRTNRGRVQKTGMSRGFRGRNSYLGNSSARGRGFPPRRRMLSGSYPIH